MHRKWYLKIGFIIIFKDNLNEKFWNWFETVAIKTSPKVRTSQRFLILAILQFYGNIMNIALYRCYRIVKP